MDELFLPLGKCKKILWVSDIQNLSYIGQGKQLY